MTTLKKADRNAPAFETDQQAILTHILLHAKYLLGMISRETYDEQNGFLLEGEQLGSFLEIEKACQKMYTDEGNIQTLYETIRGILSAEPDNLEARVVGYAKILSIEQPLLTHEFSKNLTTMHWFGGGHLNAEMYKTWDGLQEKYLARLKTVFDRAAGSGNILALSNLTMEHLEWLYKTAYIKQFFDNWDLETSSSPQVADPSVTADLTKKSGILEKVYEYCKDIEHSETQISCLCLKYQIEDFTGQKQFAATTLARVKNIIDEKDLGHSHFENYRLLADGEADHAKFHLDMEARIGHFYTIAGNSGIDLSFLEEVTAETIADFEHRFHWSVTELMEFEFPEVKEAS